MSARPVIRMLFATCVVCNACDGTNLTKFEQRSIKPLPAEFASLEVLPNSITVEQGLNAIVDIIPRDRQGQRMVFADSFSVSSSDPAIATMSSAGLVTAVAAGTAELTISKTEGSVTRTAKVKATILPANSVPFDFTADLTLGWQPIVAHVAVGRTVRWTIPQSSSWSGFPHRFLYFLRNDDGFVVDSLDLSTLSATRTFRQAGEYHFCSALCYETPDFGVIFVR